MNPEKLTKAQIKEERKLERQQMEAHMAQQAQQNKYKKILFWIGGLVVAGLAVWGLFALANTPQTSDANLVVPKTTSTDIATGPKNAKVTLTEYADFQCPACKAYHPLVNQILKDFTGKILYVYRFFPLTQIHRNAMVSAQAGYAAYLQGKFWEMNNLLFDNQDTWATQVDPTSTFASYAKQLGLDVNKFQEDYNADATKKFIQAEEDGGTQAGVNATPSFFINNKQIVNPQSYDEFKKDIQNALQSK